MVGMKLPVADGSRQPNLQRSIMAEGLKWIPGACANMVECLCAYRVKEDVFWRNYFYRVSLIKQSAQLTALAAHQQQQQKDAEEGGASVSADDIVLKGRSLVSMPRLSVFYHDWISNFVGASGLLGIWEKYFPHPEKCEKPHKILACSWIGLSIRHSIEFSRSWILQVA